MSDIPLGAIARVPGLIVRLAFTTMRFKSRVKRSAKKLRHAMIKGGMSREMATRLAARYEESFSIRELIGKASGEEFNLSSFIPF